MLKNEKIHFLLVYNHMRMGGIETLIVRMSNWLLTEGHRVTLLLKEPGDLIKLLKTEVEVEILGTKRYWFFLPFLWKKYFKRFENKSIDVIYSYSPEGCYFASYIYKYGFKTKKPIFLNGIYHPYEFAVSGTINALDRMYIDLYKNYINNSSKIFMSEEVRSGNERILMSQIPGSIIWPIPIDNKRFTNLTKKVIPYRIVSVGRFDHFKTYNIYMFNIIEELLKKGYNITWEVYGFGPLEKEMKRQLNARNLSRSIFIRGILPYDKYSEAMSVAHIFIGMGTALIEAGFCKVPSIPAIAYDTEALTYGPLYKLPYYSCGEPLSPDYKTNSITNEICRIFELNKTEYKRECELNFNYVQAYSIDELMKIFVNFSKKSPNIQKIDYYPGRKYVLYCIKSIIYELRYKFGIRTRLRRLFK